jgi:hypothetical protein
VAAVSSGSCDSASSPSPRSNRNSASAFSRFGRCIALPKPCSQRRNLHLQVRPDYCNSATRLLWIDSQPEAPGTITMSLALLNQADNAHLRGFEISPAGAPTPISRP